MSSPRRLVYFADPMCSWCWGFAPVIDRIVREHGDRLPITVVMGGHRTGSKVRLLDDALESDLRAHWQHVELTTGQAFDHRFFDRQGFLYDTAPACRAIVAARMAFPGRELGLLAHLQRAFYERGCDLTREPELLALAVEYGLDAARYEATFTSEDCAAALAQDLVAVLANGIRALPALLGGSDADRYMTVTHGWRPYEEIAATLRRLANIAELPQGFMPGPAHLPAR
jgi:putative protein-disulfide isomerase